MEGFESTEIHLIYSDQGVPLRALRWKWLYVSLGTASGQDDSQPGTRFFWKYSYTSSGNHDPAGDTADQHTPTGRDFGDVSSQRTWKGRNPSTI